MIVQTSAKMVATLSVAGAIALGVGVPALGMLAGARIAADQSVGELRPGMLMEPGWYAIAIPPIRVVDGRRVLMASAAEEECAVRFGPFLDAAECGSVRSRYSHGALLDSDYAAFKAERTVGAGEAEILADVQAWDARGIVSDGSEKFRMPSRFETGPTTDFVR
jgi:hypothetical protein